MSISRVVVLGSSGFVGQELINILATHNINCLALSSAMLDLTAADAELALAKLLQPQDSIVFLAVIGPNRGFNTLNTQAFIDNIKMAEAVAKAATAVGVKHLVYLSSDAVYNFNATNITEATIPAPDSLYGIMHLTRETILKNHINTYNSDNRHAIKVNRKDKPEVESEPEIKNNIQLSIQLSILRCTQIYGMYATHNAYGPTRLVTSALQQQKIELFGKGEDVRDFIYVADVAAIIYYVLQLQALSKDNNKLHSTKLNNTNITNNILTLNLASGNAISYLELATTVQQMCNNLGINSHQQTTIEFLPRTIASTNRTFNIENLQQLLSGQNLLLEQNLLFNLQPNLEAFSSFNPMQITQGLELLISSKVKNIADISLGTAETANTSISEAAPETATETTE